MKLDKNIATWAPFYMQLLQLRVAHHCYIGHLRYQGHLRGKLWTLVYEMGGPLELDRYQWRATRMSNGMSPTAELCSEKGVRKVLKKAFDSHI